MDLGRDKERKADSGESKMNNRKKQSLFRAVRTVWEMIRPYKKLYFLSSGISVMLVFVTLLQARLTQALIDHISAGKISRFAATVIGFFLIVGVASLLDYFRQVMVSKMAAGAVRDLKCSISEALLRADYAELTKERSGDAISTVNHDIGIVGNFLKKDMTSLFSQFSMAVGTFIYMLWVKPELALISFIYMPFGVWLLFCANRKIEPFYAAMSDEEGKSLSVVEQVLTQIPVIKSFLMEKRTQEKIYESYRQVCCVQTKAVSWGMLIPFLATAALQIPRITYLGVGGYFVIQGSLSVGAMVAMLDLLAFIIQPVESLPWLAKGLNETMAAAGRVRRLLDIPASQMPETAEKGKPSIDIRGLRFGYSGEKVLFDGFSFRQDKPGITVLCGGSGSGKTTLLDLIEGLYKPERGSITVSGEISVVTQDTYLFSESLLGNVRLARENATREEVEEALEQAGAAGFIAELPEGLDTVLGDGSLTLSGGQRQRIGLARTILQDSPIWLLDEPTSALDPETEKIIIDVIKARSAEKIILISAHRDSLIALADRKVVL